MSLQWKDLKQEYVEEHQQRSRHGAEQPALSFRDWILQRQRSSDEQVDALLRKKMTQGWTNQKFIENVEQIREINTSHYLEPEWTTPTYWLQMSNVPADIVPPWDKVLRSINENVAKYDLTQQEDLPSRQLVPAQKCSVCQEISVVDHWGWALHEFSGEEEFTYWCPTPGCACKLDTRTIEDAQVEYKKKAARRKPSLISKDHGMVVKTGVENIVCPDCRHTLCIACGLIKQGSAKKSWRKLIDGYVDPISKYPGSEPYKRAAKRGGYVDKSMRELYTPHDPNSVDENKLVPKIKDDLDDDYMKIKIREEGMEGSDNEPIDQLLKNIPDLDKDVVALPKGKIVGKQQVSKARVVGPRVARFEFNGLATTDLPDDWFKIRNQELYHFAVSVVQKWFGDIEFPKDYDGQSVWLEELGPQFIQYANAVAHEDILLGGWEAILKDKEQRKWLVTGIIAQIIERKIYNDLMFGAEPELAKELEMQDLDFAETEGYSRTKFGTHTINMYLRGRKLPRDFWPAVDDLAARTMLILIPLCNLLSYFKSPAYRSTSFALFEDLHGLIAQAAFFSVCMRRSPNIFHILSATPGARMDYSIESQADYEPYRRSKDLAEQLNKEWEAAQKEEIEKAAPSRRAEVDREYRRQQYHRLRGARVKFAVWPMVKRYKPINVGLGTRRRNHRLRAGIPDGDIMETEEGQKIVDIGKCIVVYYQGLMYPDTTANRGRPFYEKVDGLRLMTYVMVQKDIQKKLAGPKRRMISLVLVLAIYIVVWYWWQEVWREASKLNLSPRDAVVHLGKKAQWAKEYWMPVPALFFDSSRHAVATFVFFTLPALLLTWGFIKFTC
ncbi:uncharacterized protein BCR38DRAFT_481350 [Pseudomassariella vexata]|uniref:Uncharacterized protein n=1 Tax=Pseudomassariella vexata TaxID=1141098 RepID=A0A1Y2EG21_9PEZI|nr:uncharacterized protein BCR38DRAFT_481350 [Pseudomassariella vexata]ORY70206.1 hypothetical protein BCR38DRAFT_481350 [Pseudomassariella vexata]